MYAARLTRCPAGFDDSACCWFPGRWYFSPAHRNDRISRYGSLCKTYTEVVAYSVRDNLDRSSILFQSSERQFNESARWAYEGEGNSAIDAASALVVSLG